MKIELSIKVTYLPEWGAWEGLREILQNGRDARIEYGATLLVRHRVSTLTITNEGCTLSHRDLLLGQTSKYGNSALAGKFGEGLKLGLLALVRAGHAVRVRTGDEIWTPVIQKSETFGEDVLVFQIRKCKKHENAVTIEVGGVDKETWDKLRPRLLFLDDGPADDNRVETAYGTLLLGDGHTGMIFVKGIYVGSDVDLLYGYDLQDAEIDRDRKMVDKWDLRWKLRMIWQEALRRRPDLFPKFNHLLTTQKEDVAGVDDYTASSLPAEAARHVSEQFKAQFGEDAVPVTSLAESAEVEHLGKKGVVVHKGLGAVLNAVMGDAGKRKEALRKETVTQHGWHDLSDEERLSLTSGIQLVCLAVPLSLDTIDVVDFRDESIQGMFKDGRIQVAKKHLGDQDLTLEILVHEVSHHNGADGTHGHVLTVEGIWSKIVSTLRKGIA